MHENKCEEEIGAGDQVNVKKIHAKITEYSLSTRKLLKNEMNFEFGLS